MTPSYALPQMVSPSSLTVGILLFAALTVGTAEARADEAHARTSSLGWVRLDGAESCVATQALAKAVEGRLKRKVFVSASEADVSVEGHVERSSTAKGWRASLTVRDRTGETLGTRDLETREAACSALDDQIVFVVSVLIDPEAEAVREREVPPAETTKEPPRATEPAAAPAPRVIVKRERVLVPASRPDGWGVEASAGPTGQVGLLPSASMGVTAATVVEPPHFWGILISGTYWFDTSADVEQRARSEVSLAYGGGGLCPIAWSRGRFAYRVCAGALVGSLRARGLGFDSDESAGQLAVQAFVPNRFAVRIAGPLVASLGLSLFVPITHTELTYRAADGSRHVLYQPSPVAASADAGLALYLPR